MEITELPPTLVVLPTAGELVHIRTQEWALEQWEGQDPPGLAVPWARKPKFCVDGSRSCAELAIVHHLRADGWDGGWVNALRGELRMQWFPAPAGLGHDAFPVQRPRRRARWAADDVITAVASSGDDAAALARTVTGWATGPHLRLAGGTGPSYPSFTVEADSARTEGSRWRGVLALALIGHWITDVRADATEPETTTET